MKWMSVYLLGYLLFVAGVAIALWKWGIFDHIDPIWGMVIVLLTLGFGVMIAVASSGRKSNIEIDHT